MSDDPKVDPDKDLNRREISTRERLALKLILFAIGILCPGKYDHQVAAWIKFIREDLQ